MESIVNVLKHSPEQYSIQMQVEEHNDHHVTLKVHINMNSEIYRRITKTQLET